MSYDMQNKSETFLFNRDVLPYVTKALGFFNPNLFSNINIKRLEKMSIDEIRNSFIKEIKSLEGKNPLYQRRQLQKIFTNVFNFQPSRNGIFGQSLKFREQRIYADIILTPGLFELDYVRNFIENDFNFTKKNEEKHLALLKLIEIKDNLSKEAQENFDYCYRGSYHLSEYIINHYDYDLKYIFNDTFFTSFNKETCAILCRNLASNIDFFTSDRRVLFLFSQMCQMIRQQIGHTNEILEVLTFFDSNEKLKHILIEYYDKNIGSIENEEKFKKLVLENRPNDLQDIMNYLVHVRFDEKTNFISLPSNCNTLDEFLNYINEEHEKRHISILGNNAYLKLKNHDFNNIEFKEINNSRSLVALKNSFLKNIYGINYNDALNIQSKYGSYIEELKAISDQKNEAIDILESILKIMRLTYKNKEDILKMQSVYFNFFKEKGVNYHHNTSSKIVLEGLLNRIFLNTYNKVLFDPQKKDVLYYEGNIPVIDSSDEFQMLVTSLSGTDSFIEPGINLASKWNSASMDYNNGICTSFITNENLGIISLKSPLLAFTNLYQDSLNAMGPTDIFSSARSLELRSDNEYHTIFIPSSILADETRYGYNELLLDRFLTQDDEEKLKVQPSYVVYYKINDSFRFDSRYMNSVRLAKDFDIPIIIIDIPKLRKQEQKKIKTMEEELFSQKDVDSELLKRIITRYMNNISGNLTIEGPKKKDGLAYEDESSFPKEDLGNFINRVCLLIEEINDYEEKSKWIEALEMAYASEEKKYNDAIRLDNYNCSIGNTSKYFILDYKYDLNNKLKFLNRSREEALTIANFCNELDFNMKFEIEEEEIKEYLSIYNIKKNNDYLEPSIEEKIIVAYFTNDYETDILGEMQEKNNCGIKFNSNSNQLVYNLQNSPLLQKINDYDEDKINAIVDRVSEMDDDKFINIFKPFIQRMSRMENIKEDDIANSILLKKDNLKREVQFLNSLVNNKMNDYSLGGKRV